MRENAKVDSWGDRVVGGWTGWRRRALYEEGVWAVAQGKVEGFGGVSVVVWAVAQYDSGCALAGRWSWAVAPKDGKYALAGVGA